MDCRSTELLLLLLLLLLLILLLSILLKSQFNDFLCKFIDEITHYRGNTSIIRIYYSRNHLLFTII